LDSSCNTSELRLIEGIVVVGARIGVEADAEGAIAPIKKGAHSRAIGLREERRTDGFIGCNLRFGMNNPSYNTA
jgi:hypothetical protein